MSTPTQNQSGIVPSPASKKVGPASVSTPLNHYSSPAPPRSIPSPAAVRKDNAAKTPINHPTGSSQGSKTVGATPMIVSLSQQGSTASPLPVVAGLTPTGLGVDLGTPSGALGAGMAISMSELGLTTSGTIKRDEDEERRVKMRKILKSIGRVRGRVSEEGITRVSRRVGFANDIDAEKLSAEERERRVGNRTISIAGNTTVIDVELKSQQPQSVQVLFSTELASSNGQGERAGQILLQDLQSDAAEQTSTALLDRFAANLERLAVLDHLSSSKISSFDALSGIYLSLKRLYDQELLMTEKIHDKNAQSSASSRVLRQHSGQPEMHDNDKLGLTIRYWTPPNQSWRAAHPAPAKSTSFSLSISISRCQSALYPPIRVSDSWLPESFELSASETDLVSIPWQDPPPTFLAPEDDSMTDDSTQALPDMRFIVRFDPPIVMPWQVANTIHNVVGTTIAPLLQMPSYLSMLLSLSTNPQTHYSAVREVPRPKHDSSGSRTFSTTRHAYELTINKHDVGFVLEELPFSHPRQLIELLPVLRQWACIGELLRQLLQDLHTNTAKQSQIPVDALLSSQLETDNPLPVEVTLSTSPTSTLSLSFPTQSGLCCPEVQVLPNGEISVAPSSCTVPGAAQSLQVMQDLSLWIEWLLSRS